MISPPPAAVVADPEAADVLAAVVPAAEVAAGEVAAAVSSLALLSLPHPVAISTPTTAKPNADANGARRNLRVFMCAPYPPRNLHDRLGL
jgi:hypothetical protein